MLKALELVGFKSFADKTRFEFPPGITVVVGPNGSGKSNIVDAIKWVLGEQSVKSLRGKEMADVIFNGSSGRRALNSAETTLTFDNSNALLPIDSKEVHITRRVYRSGEGEYLINGQPCRLRDIKDLFAGTGVTTEAYGVIEQGKVDVLLQSSSKDRRQIFEEAAGISRFKAKKIESLRRMDRVEQNLLRLSDIVNEVDNRLRIVRSQASKARRYKQYTARLQELRTHVSLVDWRKLSDKLAAIESSLVKIRDEIGTLTGKLESIEAKALHAELGAEDSTQAIRAAEAKVAQNRERIATLETSIEHSRGRCRDLEEEVARHRRQLSSLSARVGDLQLQLHGTTESVQTAESDRHAVDQQLAQDEKAMAEAIKKRDEVRRLQEQKRAQHVELMRSIASLGNEISVLESQIESAASTRDRCHQQINEMDQTIGDTCRQLEDLRQKEQDRVFRLDSKQSDLKKSQVLLKQQQSSLITRQKELANLRQRHAGATERAAVLEDLEKRHEGLNQGVKEVLVQARRAAGGPFGEVCGLVADLLHVNVESAPMIEAALGETAQFVVLTSGDALIQHLQEESTRLSGRVGFIQLDTQSTSWVDPIDLEGQPGVVGRADRFVETDAKFANLAQRLLGRTWIVEKLSHALALAQQTDRRLNFVTLAGDVLTAEGTLIVGPRGTTTGLISRRSELRILRQQIAQLDDQIMQHATAVEHIEHQIDQQDSQVQTLEAEHQQQSDALHELQRQLHTAQERLVQFEQHRKELDEELRRTVAQYESASEALVQAQRQNQQRELDLADLEADDARQIERAQRLDKEAQEHASRVTSEKVNLAKSEQQLENLRSQQKQFDHDQQEKQRGIDEYRVQLKRANQRTAMTQQNILQAEAELAELYVRKESMAAQTVELITQRGEHHQQRDVLRQQGQQLRNNIRGLEQQLHAKELSAGEVRHERSALADRLREDYEIELAELEHQPTEEELHQREEVEQEISQLRRKITNIGGVNLDALGELEELESRYGDLADQHQDLTSAKTSLEKIIHKINADSRKLFSETLEIVRGHFQILFRKLFGGGQADIILEEGVDILESGIEIVARPPGKEPRNISLLSGGEKTLTCVALLLAIFRSRPCPFCVLDEVDAALDEANIERFIGVLNEFLAWTQFIVVTHSKKTMTCAGTLYGVTMQESGVSKRVSVRFEDVSETGEILKTADELEPETQDSPSSDDETQAA